MDVLNHTLFYRGTVWFIELEIIYYSVRNSAHSIGRRILNFEFAICNICCELFFNIIIKQKKLQTRNRSSDFDVLINVLNHTLFYRGTVWFIFVNSFYSRPYIALKKK